MRCSITPCQRRMVVGASGAALIADILTMRRMPARLAASTALSSNSTIASEKAQSSERVSTPANAASRVSGRAKSPST